MVEDSSSQQPQNFSEELEAFDALMPKTFEPEMCQEHEKVFISVDLKTKKELCYRCMKLNKTIDMEENTDIEDFFQDKFLELRKAL